MIGHLRQLACLGVDVARRHRSNRNADRECKLARDLLETFSGIRIGRVRTRSRPRERDAVGETGGRRVSDLVEIHALEIDVHSALR